MQLSKKLVRKGRIGHKSRLGRPSGHKDEGDYEGQKSQRSRLQKDPKSESEGSRPTKSGFELKDR